MDCLLNDCLVLALAGGGAGLGHARPCDIISVVVTRHRNSASRALTTATTTTQMLPITAPAMVVGWPIDWFYYFRLPVVSVYLRVLVIMGNGACWGKSAICG